MGSLANKETEDSHGYDEGEDDPYEVNGSWCDHKNNEYEDNIEEDNESEVYH